MFDSFLVSLFAVTVPLLIGGLIALLLKKDNKKIINSLVFVSIGTLFFLICFEIAPHIIKISLDINQFGLIYVIFSIIIFLLLIFVLHKFIDLIIYKHKHKHECHHVHDHGHIDVYLEKRKESLKKAGIALCVALFFHNFPEGMTLGIELKDELSHGFNLALSLGLHNLVMGITMALPLFLSDMKKRNVLILLTFSSIPSVLGALLGYAIISENTILNLIILCFSMAVLIFVVFEEIKSIVHKSFKWYYIFALIVGILLSYLITFLHIGH